MTKLIILEIFDNAKVINALGAPEKLHLRHITVLKLNFV